MRDAGTTPPRRVKGLRVAAMALALATGGGCQKPLPAPAPPPPCEQVEHIHVMMSPSKHLNQDREGHPRSLQVKVYQLRSEAALSNATFEEVWHGDDRAVLGDSLVSGPPEFTAIPGQPERVSLERHADAAWFGIAGRFREHNPGGAWKHLTRLPPPADPCKEPSPNLQVTLSDYGINAYVAGDARAAHGR